MSRPKVFGIGFHKTGTSSLGDALAILGYRVCEGFGYEDDDIAATAWPRARKLAEAHDAFEDNPWPLLYRELDAAFPGSKFILTWRDPENWLRSIVRHFGKDETAMRQWIYGAGHPEGNEGIYMKRYLDHNSEVEEYFRARPQDLLKMNLKTEGNWETLCGFLGEPKPAAAFPYSNRGGGEVPGLLRTLKQSVAGRRVRRLWRQWRRGRIDMAGR